MKAEKLVEIIGADFYTGVPDSQLAPLCGYLANMYGSDPHHHITGANEGNCVAIAAGYYFATGKVPVVYLQNSGEGNIINPVASLTNDNVYAVPTVFVIGWRGEPGVHDEPQHIYQGKVTLKLLEDMDIEYFVIGEDTADSEAEAAMAGYRKLLDCGKSVAFVIKKGALTFGTDVKYENCNTMSREDVIRHILKVTGDDAVVSSTGKISREVFEIREESKDTHRCDFLTVGSMGHSSGIALGIAINKPGKKIWCIDGDGAALMHMGAMATIGSIAPANLVHIIINNGSHESVGGMPTTATELSFADTAKTLKYPSAVCVNNFEELDAALENAKKSKSLCLIEVMCKIESRKNLGRPTTSAKENKKNFMEFLKS